MVDYNGTFAKWAWSATPLTWRASLWSESPDKPVSKLLETPLHNAAAAAAINHGDAELQDKSVHADVCLQHSFIVAYKDAGGYDFPSLYSATPAVI